MADIVLRDRNGNEIEYPGIERIKLNTTDGETAEFVSPDLVPELLEDIPIALDFSGGDQLISAPEGMAVKTATLLKPETLVPENIVEGVDIAGIIGTFAAGGGGVIEPELKDVNFYDYDGTRLYSYTIAEANALTELPAFPEHEGLICQGWNYSLETIQTTTVPIDTDAIFITDDGKTRIYFSNTSETECLMYLGLKQSVAGGITIDWGDGTAPEIITATSGVIKHTYNKPGEYVAAIEVSEGCTLTLGRGSSSDNIYYGSTRWKSIIQKIEIGAGDIVINDYAFYECFGLETITIPNNVKSIGGYAFRNCYGIKNIPIPPSIKTLSNYAFMYCISLRHFSIPESVTSIGSMALNYSSTLERITIPKSITNFANNSLGFIGYNTKTVDLSHFTTIPTADSYPLGSVQSYTDVVIKVSAALLNAWKTATNWSNYVDRYVGV